MRPHSNLRLFVVHRVRRVQDLVVQSRGFFILSYFGLVIFKQGIKNSK